MVWNKQAETCNQYLKKGSTLLVEGRLQSRSWDDSSGQKRNTIEVRAERVQFLGKAPAKETTETAAVLQDEPPISTESAWLDESEAQANES